MTRQVRLIVGAVLVLGGLAVVFATTSGGTRTFVPTGAIATGLVTFARGLLGRDPGSNTDARRQSPWAPIWTGVTFMIIAAALFVLSRFDRFGIEGSSAVMRQHVWNYVGPLAAIGVLLIASGENRMRMTRREMRPSSGAGLFEVGLIARVLIFIGGYKGFVAQRYLLIANRSVSRVTFRLLSGLLVARVLAQLVLGAGLERLDLSDPAFLVNRGLEVALVLAIVFGVLVHVRPALYSLCTALFLIAIGGILSQEVALAVSRHASALSVESYGVPQYVIIITLVFTVGGGVLAVLALLFGFLRGVFTFFTTVPVGGVWIGTAALVCVLAVMSGFESDLRQKILGSNAHIQVTREEGDFANWHQVYDQIAKLPGVVAATPYAVSEVVIASNNNGLNVIIKGIDPKTVGKVTDLVHDLEDKRAMDDLEPKHTGDLDLKVKGGSSGTVDPPPADLPSSGAPIDFSKPADGSDAKAEPAFDAKPDPKLGHTGIAPAVVDSPPPLGSDEYLVPEVDPPPPDLVTSEAPPIDYSRPRTKDDAVDPTITVLDLPTETPAVMKRTESLPGVLVGRELVKQMHLYVGQETRLVSPLSDPSNPDATGTPIPFNRDYRVAGIFFTGMYEYDLKFVYVTLDSLDEFLDRGDAIDGIEVRIGSPDDTDRYVKKISETLGPAYRVVDWKELNRSLFSALKLEKIAMFLVLGIVIIVASFSIIGNLIMVVVEKQREIALLKTLGASDQGIMGMFAIQGLLIGLIGTTIGVLTGLAFCYIGKRVGIPLNPDVYYIDKLPVNVDYGSVGMTFFAGVVISIIATFYPAFLGSRVRPATGMRH